MNDNATNDNDPRNLTLAKFEAFVNNLAPDSETQGKAIQALGALISDRPTIAPHIADIARVHMQGALLRSTPGLAAYIAQLNADAMETLYIEDMRRVHGDEMVNAALDDARTSCRTFYHALQLRIMAQSLETSLNDIRAAFVKLGTTLARGLPDVSSETPINREERRSAKYGTRRKKEGDQRWARRNNPKRRR